MKKNSYTALLAIFVLAASPCTVWSWGDYMPSAVKSLFSGDEKEKTERAEQAGDDSATYFGGANLSKKKLKKVAVYGGCTLDECEVQVLQSYGGLSAVNSTIDQLNGKGGVDLKKCTITGQESTTNGGATLNDVTVDHSLNCHGSLHANGSTFNQLHANGGVDLNKCKISGQASFKGSVTAQDTRFDEKVTIHSKKTVLKECTLKQSIFVGKEVKGTLEPQVIELTDTVIEGDVTFEQGNGKIFLKGSSKILGKVAGGNIEQ